MKIYVDADACPVQVRNVICRAASKRMINTVFAANREIPLQTNTYVSMYVCQSHEGAADDYIVSNAIENDLVITRDIPLAYRLLANNVSVLDDRGRVYTKDNIRMFLSLRDFTVSLADNGYDYERTVKRNSKTHNLFSSGFDRLLTKMLREERFRV